MSKADVDAMREILTKQGPGALVGALGGYVIEQSLADDAEIDLPALAGVAIAMSLVNLANATVAAAHGRPQHVRIPNFDPRGGLRQ